MGELANCLGGGTGGGVGLGVVMAVVATGGVHTPACPAWLAAAWLAAMRPERGEEAAAAAAM